MKKRWNYDCFWRAFFQRWNFSLFHIFFKNWHWNVIDESTLKQRRVFNGFGHPKNIEQAFIIIKIKRRKINVESMLTVPVATFVMNKFVILQLIRHFTDHLVHFKWRERFQYYSSQENSWKKVINIVQCNHEPRDLSHDTFSSGPRALDYHVYAIEYFSTNAAGYSTGKIYL